MNENIITSSQNSKVQSIRTLKQKQVRDMHGMFVAEGKKIISDAIRAGIPMKRLFVLETKVDKFTDIIRHTKDNNVEIILVNDKVLSAICQTKSPQGIVASFSQLDHTLDTDCLDNSSFVAILQDISDPGNLGTIIRTCDAVGCDMILMQECADIYNNKVIRSSMGSIFNIKLKKVDLDECISTMVASSWQIGCGHLDGTNFYKRTQDKKVALVIANEARGVTQSTAKLCTDLWKLPMRGSTNSLNAAIAAGIMLYDIQQKMNPSS